MESTNATVQSAPPALPKPAKPQPAACPLPTIDDVDSSRTLTPVSTHSPHPKDESNPCSAFYCHPPTRYSFEIQKSETKPIVEVITVDLESGLGQRISAESQQRKDSEIWPGKHTLRSRERCRRKNGIMGRMNRMDRKTKIWLKIGIVLFIVAAALLIGIGVSKAIGGGVWKSAQRPNAKIGGKL